MLNFLKTFRDDSNLSKPMTFFLLGGDFHLSSDDERLLKTQKGNKNHKSKRKKNSQV